MAHTALTPKQQRFVDEYLVSGNATDAYQRAYGGTRATADANGSRSLGNARIAAAIAKRQAKVSARVDLTLQSHLDRLNELANQAADAEQFGPAVSAEVSRGKASGFYIDRQEHRFPDLPREQAVGRLATVLAGARVRKASR